jgi:GTP-binding protein
MIKSVELNKTVFKKGNYPVPLTREIAFSGRSNVGKSSLLNALFGRRLAKISSTPGKTRSINFYTVNGEIYFVDLPGYGYARASMKEKEKWESLILDYFDTRKNISLMTVLMDSRHPFQAVDRQMLDWVVHYSVPFVVVLTKADKLSRNQQAITVRSVKKEIALWGSPPVLMVSAENRQGIEELLSLLL